jgi:hypothetical protein
MAKGLVVRRGRMLWLLPCVFLALAMAGCGSSAPYRGGSSWSFSLPSGWYRVNFSDSAGKVVSAGVQISNVPLQRPTLMPGFPIQVRDNALPARGVGLIVATDKDPQAVPYGHVTTLPLPSPSGARVSGWNFASALGGQPYLEMLTFRADGRTFVADLKVGPSVSGADMKALTGIVRSLHMPS